MAMGLDFLGRGKRWRTIWVGILHILGATLGGAAVGGLLGWLGLLLSLAAWRLEIIVFTAAFALWHSLSRQPPRLGLRRQVPRKWASTMPAAPRYFLWGLLLGSGIATLIPYASLLVVLAAQLTSGPLVGCLSGALFGGMREAVALIPSLRQGTAEPEPKKTMELLPALASQVARLNTIWIFGGGLLLVIASWH